MVYMGQGEPIRLWGGSIWSGRVPYRVCMARGDSCRVCMGLRGVIGHLEGGVYGPWAEGGPLWGPYVPGPAQPEATGAAAPGPAPRRLRGGPDPAARGRGGDPRVPRHQGGTTHRDTGGTELCPRRPAPPHPATRSWGRCRGGTPVSGGVPSAPPASTWPWSTSSSVAPRPRPPPWPGPSPSCSTALRCHPRVTAASPCGSSCPHGCPQGGPMPPPCLVPMAITIPSHCPEVPHVCPQVPMGVPRGSHVPTHVLCPPRVPSPWPSPSCCIAPRCHTCVTAMSRLCPCPHGAPWSTLCPAPPCPLPPCVPGWGGVGWDGTPPAPDAW